MKLIDLNLSNGTTTYVNADHIIRLIKGISCTQAVLTNGVVLEVEEPIEQVVKNLRLLEEK